MLVFTLRTGQYPLTQKLKRCVNNQAKNRHVLQMHVNRDDWGWRGRSRVGVG